MVINLFQHRDYRIVILNLTPSLSRQVMCEVSDTNYIYTHQMYSYTCECVSVSAPAKHVYYSYTHVLSA